MSPSSERNDLKPVDRSDLRLVPEALRWCVDERWLPFESTEDVEPISGVVGQDDAMEALTFGLENSGPGQNVFVRGLTGTGRMTLVRKLMTEIQPSCPLAEDRCYVHNFSHPDRPRLITVPRGHGDKLRARVEQLVDFIGNELVPSLASDTLRARKEKLDEALQEQMRQMGDPFEQELKEANLAVVPIQVGQTVHPSILPIIDGKPAAMERFRELRSQGVITEADAEQLIEKIGSFEKRFKEVSEKIQEIQDKHRSAVQELYDSESRSLLHRSVKGIEQSFPQESVKTFLDELMDDLIRNRLKTLKDDKEFTALYQVNVVLSHDAGESCPIVVENTPSLQKLLGNIEREFVGGVVRSNHMMIKAGSILRADGGFLILEARDLLAEPGAWKVLIRTLRTGKLEIVPSEMTLFWSGPVLKPEPIDINVKVILLGDPDLYYTLDAYDRDFADLFKVLADFDTSIERDENGVRYYAGVISRIAKEEGLPPFSRGAIGALAEQGARIAASQSRLTTRFGRLADIAREAAFITRKEAETRVTEEVVNRAIERAKRRADLPARRFRKLVSKGTIRLQVQGAVVGQVNGLAVTHAGPLTYGFPTRITATIGPGTAGAINIERESQLSGAIHTKGFYILGGLLRHLLRTDHPLAFSASVAFEQSYGGIDGDSASGAEMCCLLSALTDVPLRQDIAMTGAIDQVGHILPVGAVAEKVEGFFDTCLGLGLSGNQGVIIRGANAEDLMLRDDVVKACREGRFHGYSVGSIHDALELLTGLSAGGPHTDGQYPQDTVLGKAKEMAMAYWRMASPKPPGKTASETD